ncbi:flagellar basal body-associated FliL family protein [Enterococcus saccharolyticus]|uniref:Flagellar protein FliL n=1 Tax=Candidatus Enterococcus willemsii TaxID=1857215 RepID=A0ABQ6YXC3_9ENTE|nr:MULTISPECIES: flagellar basal body-associated FliL family protein [Enterococcus]KAF1302015.1 hypothetical protein BAU17_01205 [Enterococcus sp. CU12B]MCD5002877.1 flagellar basal body-associated FliL family protein [Enterococcus saccharolyticus]
MVEKKANKKATKAEKKANKEQKEKKDINIGIVLPLILVLAIIGSVIGTIVTTKFLLPTPAAGQIIEKEVQPGKIEEGQVVVPLEEFLVNLAQTENKPQQYIRVTTSILIDEKNSDEVEKGIALVRDGIVNTLRKKHESDILNTEDGMDRLKAELKDTINNAYGKEIIRDVFITDLVIQ